MVDRLGGTAAAGTEEALRVVYAQAFAEPLNKEAEEPRTRTFRSQVRKATLLGCAGTHRGR